jgi:ceramide glucosyltransferase
VIVALARVAAYLALAWAAILLWLGLGAVIRRAQLHHRFRSRAPACAAGRRIVLIRPCAGLEPGLLDNLLSVQTAECEAELRVVLTVDSPDDAALPVLEAAAAQLRAEGLDAAVEIHPPTGPNRKASMIAAVLRGHGPTREVIVNVDSNVDLDGFDLDALLEPVLATAAEVGERVGVAWAPWVEQRTAAGVGPRCSEAVLGGSLTAFPLLCALHPHGLVGKIWAARIDALTSTGEFGELARYLGEDLAMADRLLAGGWKIAVVPVLGRVRGGAPSFEQVVERFGRWMLVVRGQQPRLLPSYPLFFFATPLVLALALLGAPAAPGASLVALGLAASARLIVTLTARHWSGRGLRAIPALLDAALSDTVLLLAWLRAVTRREVEWRGRRLRVEPGGELSAIEIE